jgi:hypothetical protein
LKRASSRRAKKRRKYTKRNPEKVRPGVVTEIIQPMRVFVWFCPRKGCPRNSFAERFQATVEGFLMEQVNRHIAMHDRQDKTAQRKSDIAAKTEAFGATNSGGQTT